MATEGRIVALATLLAFAMLSLYGCASSPSEDSDPRPLSGSSAESLSAVRKPTISIFIVSGCPIARAYAEDLRVLRSDLDREFHGAIALELILAEPGATEAAATDLVSRYGYPSPVIPDPVMAVARRLGATSSPEAVVTDGDGRVIYRGRIDDTWTALRRRRESPTKRSLRDAITAMASGVAVSEPTTPVVGCKLELR